ncbi:hypothetical protein JCM19231_2925 [Vibrio ishigakensis]|uniref:Uncharacterized protein n=1 Tax=Vibrio ishigakensis TaxID=1481914 RepID=A0A0B8P6A3_9VIBR|nr:hypothetical protein JCM19231_2925 [Vibrio ishigakensis]
MVVLTDKAGIEFVRFGTTLNFELRKEQHLRGLKTGFFYSNGQKQDYRFFHDTRLLGRISRREKNALLAKTAIRNRLVRKARNGELRISVKELYVGSAETVALIERVLIHAFIYTSRILNHYKDRGGEVAGVEYRYPSNYLVKSEVRETVLELLKNFDSSVEVDNRALEMVDSWYIKGDTQASCSKEVRKKLATENARKTRTANLFGLLKTAIASGKSQGSLSNVMIENRANQLEHKSVQKLEEVSYPEALELKAQITSMESKMAYYRDIAVMNHQDYCDLGGDAMLLSLQESANDPDLLQDMKQRKELRDNNLEKIQSLASTVREHRQRLNGSKYQQL